MRQRVRFHERVNVYTPDTAPSSESGESLSPTSDQPQDEVLRGSDREAEFWNGMSCDTVDAGVKLIRALCKPKAGDEPKCTKEA